MLATSWAEWRNSLLSGLGADLRELPRDPLTAPALDPGQLVQAMATRGVRWIVNGSPCCSPPASTWWRIAQVLTDLDGFPQPTPDCGGQSPHDDLDLF